MPPSNVRKEEAELRQIAKQARLARKEVQQRERKQRQRERRAAAKNGEAATAAQQTAASSAMRTRGAIILPDEVQELRQRLMGDDAASAASAADSPARKTKKAAARKAARSPAKKSAGAAGASNHGAASSSTLVPTYHQEVHFKKKMFFVDVVLHHVPHQKIDISETNTNRLVVDTCGHTKKYRLVLPYPKGMLCDAAAATYEFENGILQCRLPIMDGAIPASLEAENAKMIEKMRQQRALRFRVTRDGDLTVRTRQALLTQAPAAQAALPEAKKAAAAQRGDDTDSDNEVVNAQAREAKGTEKMASPKSRKRTRDGDEEDSKETPQQTRSVSAKKAKGAAAAVNTLPTEAATASKPAAKKSKPDVFEAEHAKVMEAAKAAAAKVHLSMRERVKLAKAVQASREERLQTRSLRKERKEEQKQQSFHRILEEQKRQLLARASMQQPAPSPTAKVNASAKAVHFADE
ncbi:conserved hypothetical protein [Leishmania major strain Friedlin]|uniref:Uncharacterized protein n=1 Tax=Leishmania major TaxID=5664 RepID=Q4QIN5_LEIMA|nr:conserved hypothetical protein [Leishmania major strain Friedlin]CAG9568994.1 hypothetical_protein_-_conserved [Leishmania major strain Friedlin]CAJ07018.1 conserved hypothetical protein [Leishmania major strain Friedlin]|eukprot:XP_001680963.1 conserved hypothetical protein [Leishmania major strain Friedlin]